jgi:dCTP deaminase
MIIGKLAFWSMQGEATPYSGKYLGSSSTVASRLNLDKHPSVRG